MARKASPEMMQALIDCVRSPDSDWNEKIRAAEVVLTRAWGVQGKAELDFGEKVNQITIVIERGEPAAAAVPQLERPMITIDTEPMGSGD